MCDGRQCFMSLGSTCRELECASYGGVRIAGGIHLHWNKMVFFLIFGIVVESCPLRFRGPQVLVAYLLVQESPCLVQYNKDSLLDNISIQVSPCVS